MSSDLDTTAESATKALILDTAIRLFGTKSFETVSLRDITAAAKVNLGAVNYHFGSKFNLIREVLQTLAEPITEERLASLSLYELSLKGERPELEEIIRILVGPFVRAGRDKHSRSFYYPRLVMLARAMPGDHMGAYISAQHDELARRFIRAMRRATPELGEETAYWRYGFAIGAMLNVVGDAYWSYRLKGLSQGRCDTDQADRVTEELVSFIAAGMRGSPLDVGKKHRSMKRKTR